MSATSSIEWTDATWNALAGCNEVSPGCTNCYAAIMAHRLGAMAEADIAAGRDPGRKRMYIGTTRKAPSRKIVWTGKINLDEKALTIPLHVKKPKRYFVNSMSDLFHDDVPDAFIDKVFAVMAKAHRHTFQVLTKRAKRMQAFISDPCLRQRIGTGIGIPTWRWPLPNVWLGVSVEDQKRKDRIDILRAVPAAVRFLSLEPLLEDLGELDLSGIHWTIAGGESGHGARPCNVAWIRSIVEQCKAAGVACFVKQLGKRPVSTVKGDFMARKRIAESGPLLKPGEQECWFLMPSDGKGGDPAEWPEDLRVRQFPEVAHA